MLKCVKKTVVQIYQLKLIRYGWLITIVIVWLPLILAEARHCM